jgi:phospholipid/cholesterol/gamma-HCH transport system substrate-binding protein
MAKSKDLVVGLFVLAGIAFTVLVVFLLGDEKRLFETQITLETSFADVQGLKPGAPVRMGGIDIGTVEQVGYAENVDDTNIYVRMSIVRSEARRIRTDSKARVQTRGLLGDKMIEITLGKDGGPIEDGAHLPSEVPKDMFTRVDEIAKKADDVMADVQKVSSELANEELHEDIRGTADSLNKIAKQVADGQGYAGRLIHDPAEAERISRAVEGFERTTNELSLTLRQTRAIVARIEQGPGFAHDVIYGDGPSKAIAQFGFAAEELGTTLKGVREGDGLAKTVLYGGDGGHGKNTLENLDHMTADLRDIVANMKAGKGTVGALLVDPSVYEDVKTVLGNVQRNDVLRALVRYSINQDEKKPSVSVEAAAAK